jgi:replication factor C subunit 3/5
MNISFFDDKPFLEDLDFKLDTLLLFKNINIDELNNLLFYGPSGSGKSTKVYALLASIFNSSKVYDLKNMSFEDDKKIFSYKSSIYHIEVDIFNLGSNDKTFIQNFLKNYTETRNIGLDIPKIVFIKNANLLSKQSQLSMRKLIENNYYSSKFIFEINSFDNFSEPLKSRCLAIRVPMPNLDDTKTCIKNYSLKKNYNINDTDIDYIINNSNINRQLNLKKIFGYYRFFIVTNGHFNFIYYDKFKELGDIITKKVTFTSMNKIRELIHLMYINLVPMNELIEYIFNLTVDKYKDNNDYIDKIIQLYNETYQRFKNGNKDCLHAEYFIISVITIDI